LGDVTVGLGGLTLNENRLGLGREASAVDGATALRILAGKRLARPATLNTRTGPAQRLGV
jgi:hypothetical protein